MPHRAQDRPSGSHLPGSQAGGGVFRADDDPSPVVQAALWLHQHSGPERTTDEPGPGAAPPPDDPGPGAAPLPDDPVRMGPDADAEEVARKILLDQLTGQARSRAELADKLAKRRVPDEVAERLLTRFEEVGLIDDAAFARAWVESRQPGKGLGRRALAQELRRKGIEEDIAKAALADVEPEDEEAAARALVRRRLRTLRGVDRATATRRLAGMLARKGHAGDVVWRVVREELDTVAVESSEEAADLDGDPWSP